MASNLRVDSIVPATGSSVSIGTATGGVNIPGVLTYEDVTNVDSVGVITARSGINVTSGRIGIGTDNPQKEIDTIHATNSQDVRIWSQGDQNASRLILRTGNNGNSFVLFGDTADEDIGSIRYVHHSNDNSMRFTTNTGERLRIGSAGQIGIAGANYGTAGQVLTSQGSGSAVQWATPSAPFGGALDGLNFGGTETTYTSGGTTYKVHSFTSSGFFRVTAAVSMNFLIVGGGGGSSNAELSYGATGGGGAGGMVEGTGITIPVGKHTITVGSGGAAGGTYALAGNGGDSVFNYGTTITAKGGGGGSDYGTDGQDGGSGSGGAEPNRAAGASTQSSQNSGISGIAQFGNAGGAAAGYQNGAGGGGGAGGAGQARSAGGAGGSGRANTITGSSVTYAVGGAGGATGYANGSAGTNGRGNGASGATSSHPNEGAGAVGGSGIVIIRYVFT